MNRDPIYRNSRVESVPRASGDVAIGVWNDVGLGIGFKVSDIAFEVLKARPRFRPAPYMASRGLTWIQFHDQVGPVDDDVLELLRGSYALILAKLARAARIALGGG